MQATNRDARKYAAKRRERKVMKAQKSHHKIAVTAHAEKVDESEMLVVTPGEKQNGEVSKQYQNREDGELSKGLEKMSLPDWVQQHTAVSEEDFAKDTSRNRFAILLSRTNHLSYHLGQAVLGLK